MLPSSRARLSTALLSQARRTALTSSRAYATDNPVPANDPDPKPRATNVSDTNALPTSAGGAQDHTLQEFPGEAEEKRVAQAPNRDAIWSRSQRPRGDAMVGPRFEQAMIDAQPRPYSAMELIHKQPVRWTTSRSVACDGGGGPLGHPRIFINTDRPQICWCTYCGVPFANESHRAFLEAQPSTTYPLEPKGDPAEVEPAQNLSGEAFGHR